MKKIKALVMILLTTSCSLSKNSFNARIIPESEYFSTQNENIKIIDKSAFEFHDVPDNNSIYNLVSDKNHFVVIYTFNKLVPKGIADGNYREEIIIEMDRKTRIPVSSGKNQKMIFGRFCYCKGYTGYFPVSQSDYTKTGNTGHSVYKFNFKIDGIPQIRQTISFQL